MLSRVTSRSVVKNFLRQSKRGVSLLVNNTGLDDESVMIQEMAYKYAQEELEPKMLRRQQSGTRRSISRSMFTKTLRTLASEAST